MKIFVWYLPLIHLLWPIYWLFFSPTDPFEINTAVGYFGLVMAVYLLFVLYFFIWGLKKRHTKTYKPFWMAYAASFFFPWIFVPFYEIIFQQLYAFIIAAIIILGLLVGALVFALKRKR